MLMVPLNKQYRGRTITFRRVWCS